MNRGARARLVLGSLVVLAALAQAPAAQARYASIVVDFATGEVLHEVNADTRNYPASLTKMMTIYLTFEALERGDLSLDRKLKVSRRAAGMPSSKLGLRVGETITVRQAILALVTKSANDAAVVLAEALAGQESRFARVMTKKAQALGMDRTAFRNASGLPNRHQLSTARDMAILARALIRDFPDYYGMFSTPEFTYKGRTHRNHNRLLDRYEGTDGIKTGYIRASGFNLVASAVRDGRRLIAVVFGGKSPRTRDLHITKLLDRGFVQAADRGLGRMPSPPPRKPVTVVADLAAPAKPSAADPIEEAGIDFAAAEMGSAEVGTAEASAPAGGWGVQVGAYYRQEAAERAADLTAQRFPELLGNAEPLITHIKGRRKPIYRARLIGLTEDDARAACRVLEAAKVDCLVVVQPRPTVALDQAAANLATN